MKKVPVTCKFCIYRLTQPTQALTSQLRMNFVYIYIYIFHFGVWSNPIIMYSFWNKIWNWNDSWVQIVDCSKINFNFWKRPNSYCFVLESDQTLKSYMSPYWSMFYFGFWNKIDSNYNIYTRFTIGSKFGCLTSLKHFFLSALNITTVLQLSGLFFN